jgi:hypothetical protein
MPTHPASADIGQRDGLSDLDVERITTLYGCSKFHECKTGLFWTKQLFLKICWGSLISSVI